MSISTRPEGVTKTNLPPISTGLLQRAGAYEHNAAVNDSPTNEVPSIVHDVLRSPGQPLDTQTRSYMEPRFGYDFSHVRVHTDAKAAESAQAVNALAYTVGQNIVFGPGQHMPNTISGRNLLAHELTHTIQQKKTANFIQQRFGVTPYDNIYEHEATQATTLISQGNLANMHFTPASSSVQRAVDPEVDVLMVGHASPIWEHTQGSTREELNLNLSADRVAEIERFYREIFNRNYGTRGVPSYGFVRQSVNFLSQNEINLLSSQAVGSSETIVEARGNIRANDPSMRRVDITTRIITHVTGDAPTSTPVTETHEEETATRLWAVRIVSSLSAGEVVGGGVAMGEFKNRRTGQTAVGFFGGAGLTGGVELPIPEVAPDPTWSNFTTREPMVFDDFDGVLARLTDLSIGIGVAGYSTAWFEIEGMDEAVYVGDFVMNEWGVGGSVIFGGWIFESIPRPRTITTESIQTERHPYSFTIPDEFEHTVYFATGSATIDDTNLAQLENYIESIIRQIEVAVEQYTT